MGQVAIEYRPMDNDVQRWETSMKQFSWALIPTLGLCLSACGEKADLYLDGGFEPTPHTLNIQVKADTALAEISHNADCLGLGPHKPTLTLAYNKTKAAVLIFRAFDGDADMTLMVETPGGQFVCNDDYFLLDPQASIAAPDNGLYKIWVGIHENDAISDITARLAISETAR
ncbi:hypothetical protein [Woodsholea maritima]|uniref:hypothetical protein n=1 Tax=Woodsholea maritima TaxID=240237 RepID=UPI0003803921|nr:hypothetical protein [Woodsholea maritima]